MKNKLKQLTKNVHFPLFACMGILFLTVILTSIITGMFLGNRLKEIESQLRWQDSAVSVSPMDETAKYVLKEYEGRIGVFKNESTMPTEVLNVYVFTLPSADRSALKIGISVYGAEALQSLIEDFTG